MSLRLLGQSSMDKRATGTVVAIATVWAAIILYFALHSALN
jgi:hypothetical protein